MVTRTRSPKPVPSGRPEEEELQYRRCCNGKRRSRRARTLPRLRRDVAQPDGRIPDSVPEHHGDEDAIAVTGNPDIRVPDVMKKDNGLRAAHALGAEDAKKDAVEKRGRKSVRSGRPEEEEEKNSSTGDAATGKEGPEERKLRHVSGGTWLNQDIRANTTQQRFLTRQSLLVFLLLNSAHAKL
ncbi:hypothetical protein NDU88_001733 [Pleurodeles waltl]|uniref:Uncharacterized protein n=1 Tax=Pleurodeles waltl TaxID=8319 RepID=A0AAV7MLT0_PLEWA|nr:hypothetical protein NDU88_001733 [Pleurodeles waltl]